MSPRFERWLPSLTFFVLLGAYHVTFGAFFPNRNGAIGNDYSFMLPQLLAGSDWFAANGIASVPWFTPAFCGGLPFLADPQSFYYSVPQILALGINPLAAVYITVLLFAALGYWGFYLLVRECFGVSRAAAILSAGLFMFNGFYAYRMVIGHFTFHAFMLVPWIGWALLRPAQEGISPSPLRDVRLGVVAGILGAYWIYSGMVVIVLPAALTVIAIVLIYRLRAIALAAVTVGLRSAVSLLVMFGLSAPKLVASFSFVAAFPRSGYRLPGMEGVWSTIVLLFKALFLAPPNIQVEISDALRNVQWAIGRHELEYGIGMVPLALLVWGLWRFLADLIAAVPRARIPIEIKRLLRRPLSLLLLVLLLMAPIALNTYAPEWNALIKMTPILNESSLLFRWFIIYIPAALILAAVIFERIDPPLRPALAATALTCSVLGVIAADKLSYQAESYRPDTVLDGARALSIQHAPRPISTVRYQVRDANGRLMASSDSANDQLVDGASELACYNPVFGYRLENFPVKTLHPGSINDIFEGTLNFKNPACYAYPSDNDCSPGDHFKVAQADQLERLVHYRPYDFKFSVWQRLANWTFGTTATLSVLVLLPWRIGRRGARRSSDQPAS